MSLRVSRKAGLVGVTLLAFSGAALMGGEASALTLTEDYTLEGDVTDGIVVEADTSVTLNLNGHSVTNTTAGMAAIINRGTLTITGTGSVSTDQATTAAVTNYPDATLTISGGSYTSAKWYIIRNYGAMTINEGVTITANDATESNASMVTNGWYGSVDQNNGSGITAGSGEAEPSLTINGGDFTAGLTNCSVIKNDDFSHLVINGGNFAQPRGSAEDCDSVILNWNEAEIKGGTFFSENGPVVSNGAYAAAEDKGRITISGGTFTIGENGTVLGYGLNGNGTGEMTITGGTFSTSVYPMPVNPNAANDGKYYDILVKGGTYGTAFSEAGEALIAEGYGVYRRGEGVYQVLADDVAPTALTAVNLSTSAVTVAINEEKAVTISYNEGFNLDEIDTDPELTYVTYKSGDEEAAWIGFDGEYVDDDEYVFDYNSLYVYGSQAGEVVYTVTITDKAGNSISKDITVTVEDALKVGGDAVLVDDMPVYFVIAEFETPVEGATAVEVTGEEMTEELQALDENLQFVFDVKAVDEDGNPVEVSGNKVKLSIEGPEEQFGDFDYYQIVYIKDGVIVEYIDPISNKECNDGWCSISFETSHFSTYGVLASNEEFAAAEDRNALLAPETGAFTANGGSSMDYRGLIATVVAMTVMMIVMEIATYRKRQNTRE